MKKILLFILLLELVYNVAYEIKYYSDEYQLSRYEFYVRSEVYGSQSFEGDGKKYLRKLLNDGKWEPGYRDCNYDAWFFCCNDKIDKIIEYAAYEGVYYDVNANKIIEYAAYEGVFYDVNANKHLVLTDEEKMTLNEYLDYKPMPLYPPFY